MTLQVKSRHCYACYLVPEGDKEWYLYAARAGLPIGVASHRSYVGLTRSPVESSDKSARAATPIFIHNGAPQALEGCYENEPRMRGHVGWALGSRVTL